jgi:hypothetical protein
MKIKNWDKLDNQNLEICGAEFRIKTSPNNDPEYKMAAIDLYMYTHIFDISLIPSNDEFNLICKFNKNNSFDNISSHNFESIIKKKDIQTMNSFMSILDDLIAKKSVLAAYFYLMAEIQKTPQKNNKFKKIIPSGIHGFPAKSNPIIVN